MDDSCFGVFAKYWRPGRVKTRLARSIGDVKAAQVARALLTGSIARFRGMAQQQVVAYSPDDEPTRAAFSTPSFAGWRCRPQAEGDLGERMLAFFRSELSAGARSVVLVGSDSPNFPLERIGKAFELLRSHEVVLGPTEDGGYYLIGMSKQIPEIFDGMPWSTPDLWQATIDRLATQRESFQALQPWYDVDDIDDLNRLVADLERDGTRDAVLDRLRTDLVGVLESP